MRRAAKGRKTFTTMFKKLVIRHYENSEKKSKRNTAKIFKISRTSVREWLEEKDELMKQKYALSRRKISICSKTKRALYHDAESTVYEWFKNQRSQNNVMTTISIQNKMREIMNVMHPEDSIIFKASRGWL